MDAMLMSGIATSPTKMAYMNRSPSVIAPASTERPPSRIIKIPIAPMMIVANEPTPEMPVMVAAMLRNSALAPRVNTRRSLRSAWYALTIRIPPSVSARRPVTSALILPRSRKIGRIVPNALLAASPNTTKNVKASAVM